MTAARLIDLSVPIDDVVSERVPVRIRYFDHRDGARQMGTIFDVAPERWPDGLGWAGEEVTLITHAGTHMDAPSHYGPLTRGEPALAIDAVPLDWCYGPGLVLDLRHVPAGGAITVAHLDAAARAAGREPAPGDIVLLMTGAAGAWGRDDYPDAGCGLIRSSLIWLLDRGVRVIGTDAWGLDRPFQALRADLARTGDLDAVWAVHFYGRERAYCQVEKLTNLDRLPPTGFVVCCFPVKVARASAGWVRAVAILSNGDAAEAPGAAVREEGGDA